MFTIIIIFFPFHVDLTVLQPFPLYTYIIPHVSILCLKGPIYNETAVAHYGPNPIYTKRPSVNPAKRFGCVNEVGCEGDIFVHVGQVPTESMYWTFVTMETKHLLLSSRFDCIL